MGHSVSKGRRTLENASLVRDVTYLRGQISKHEEAYDKLQREHEQLKDKVNKQTQEFEKVKEENIKLKKALNSASVSQDDNTVMPHGKSQSAIAFSLQLNIKALNSSLETSSQRKRYNDYWESFFVINNDV